MSEERLNDDLAAIEAALCSLTPVASGIERDRLMFLAGKVAANRGSSRRKLAATLWPIVTAASLLAAAAFGALWATGGNPGLVERPGNALMADLPAPYNLPVDASPPSPWENRRFCQLVLEKGIDAVPESKSRRVSGIPSVPRDETYRSLLKQFLDNPTG